MPFEKVDKQIDFAAQESRVLEFWKQRRIFARLREQNANGPIWSFLDGPITANNPMGVHHAWGRTYKDAFQRYHAMCGCRQRYQNGFDCQGLWVEVEVEKQLKEEGVPLHTKRDIENLVPGDPFASIDKFVRLCKERVDKYARIQTRQSIRLGYWMNWDDPDDDAAWLKPPDERNSYFTMSEENNYTIWAFLKKCHDRRLVYKAYDAMPWCPRCSVGISQMEMDEGYRLVAHKSVFVRFPLRGRPGENLLVWTTTPWTLTSNVAAAVNPELTYLKVEHKGQVYYVAEGAFTAVRLEEEYRNREKGNTWVEGVPKLKPVEQHFKEKGGYKIVDKVKGADMVGWAYDGPYDDLPAQKHPAGFPDEIADVVRKQKWAPEKSASAVHRVIAWADVGEKEGTGIVHIAPGCGKEDFALGREQGLPPIAPLDEDGVFVEGFGLLTGHSAVDPATADWIIEDLLSRGLLPAVERYPHNYPHCWRCKTELLFRLVDEWFINMGPPRTEEGYRGEIMKVVNQVEFLPPAINGQAAEREWLLNMRDWMISKKRFWGLALPIWVDEVTGDFEVIGSREELKKRAVEGWDEFEGHSPHRPWIDKVKIKNPKTGNRMSRIPDVGNPWLDAGIVAFSTMGYNKDRVEWAKWYPVDLITECFPGQFRNWFYALLAMSTMMANRPPFKTLLGHGLVRDQHGEEMHKSSGNAIPFEGAAESGYWTIVRPLKEKETPEQALQDVGDADGALELQIQEVMRKGHKVQAVMGRYPPMGADLMRWMYCRTNPATNINFGPGPATKMRAAFTLKLWNTYSFLCEYAALDGFDLAAPQVPVAKRPDMDRWILSDLQQLVKTARKSFEEYDLQTFCLAAERFVDEKLSNWYVRGNRRRFWKAADGEDKLSAYQTLHTVLVTLTKLFAPIMPFLSEVMYCNLVVRESNPESVHLCPFPEEDPALLDVALSEEMGALLRLVKLGGSARDTAGQGRRQPLAELTVQPGNDLERRAVIKLGYLLADELSVKKVTVRDPGTGPRLALTIKVNRGTLAPKAKKLWPTVQAAIEAGGPEILALAEGGREAVEIAGVNVTREDLQVTVTAPEGWTGAADQGTQVLLDVRLTPALILEGQARDIVRLVQDLRKKAKLEMSDRIELYLGTDSEKLRAAIAEHQDYLAAETLTTRWATGPLAVPQEQQTTANVDSQALTIHLRKV
jgi:isoleucyl-tRNA synthetase